jgi:predicted ATPase/DNA-binding CsgD family transcriptional regulator
MDQNQPPVESFQADNLTWREQEILILLSERLTNKEIANRLHLAETTVKDYVGNILSKLYVKNRRQAVERAKQMGLLESGTRTPARPRINLPAERTPFVGRKLELVEIQQLLQDTRLLTLTGPGGIGKTRLAIKAAEFAAETFRDGCYFIGLAPIQNIDQIPQTIAESIKAPLTTQEEPLQQLLRYLKNRELLLVIDNYEHLLDGAGLVSEILQSAPNVKVLAASREQLNLQSETVMTISGLGLQRDAADAEGDTSEAVALFVQSARKVLPEFAPDLTQLPQIENICRIVGGMPLAIELAAAWLNLLNLHEIIAELEKGLDILTADLRDAPERHKSIRSVFDYSWLLIDQGEKETFKRLSVFAGGFTREAAQNVTDASLPILAGLVEKSFLSHDPDTNRFEIHELLRQYAQEKLEDDLEASNAVRELHAEFYSGFIQQRESLIRGAQQLTALVEIEADIENLRAGWRFYLGKKDVPQMQKFFYGMWQIYSIRWWNHAGMVLFKEAASAMQGQKDGITQAACGLAKTFQAFFMAWLEAPDQGYAIARQSIEILENLEQAEALALAVYALIVNAYMINKVGEIDDAVDRMRNIVLALDDGWLKGFCLFALEMVALIKGDLSLARQYAEENLKICSQIGDQITATKPLIVLGHAALACEELEQARGFYQHCLDISEQVGFHYSTQTATKYLGKVTVSLGDIAAAEDYLHRSLKISKEIGFLRDMTRLLYEYSRLRRLQGELEESVEILSLILPHPGSDQHRWLEGYLRDNIKDLLAKLEDELSPEVYSAAVERGRRLILEKVVDQILSTPPNS